MLAKLTLFIGLLAAWLPAAPIATWTFNGVCADCPGNGLGVLTISQATPTSPLTFEYTYSSPWIAYTMDNAALYLENTLFTGTSLTFPPAVNWFRFVQTVPITSFGGLGNPLPPGVVNDGPVSFYFDNLTGIWSTGSQAFVDDFGGPGSGAWSLGAPSTVPEPSSAVLMGAGIGILLLGARKRLA